MATIEEFFKTDIAFSGDFATTPTGDIGKIKGLENVKQALFHRLVTKAGSLIHRPNYGVGIQDYQNAPATLDTKRRLALKIQEQFELDPRVKEVTGIAVNLDSIDPSKVVIVVRVKLQGYDEEAMKFIPFGEGV